MSREGLPRKLAEFEISLPAIQVEGFFKATGWQTPMRPAMHPALPTCFRRGEFLAFQELGIELASVLHGEQKYEYVTPLKADVPYAGVTSLIQFYEKSGKGNSMKFFVFRTELRDGPAGALCVACETTIIVREKK